MGGRQKRRNGQKSKNRQTAGKEGGVGERDGIGVSVYRPFPRESTVGSTEWHYLLHSVHRFAAAMFQTPFFSLSLLHVSYVLVSPAKKFFNMNRVRGLK